MSMEGYSELLSMTAIKLWMKRGSKYDDTLPLMKAQYDFGNSIDPEMFIKLLIDERDSYLMESTELEALTSGVSIMHYVINPPIFLMKPRDFVEKRITITVDIKHLYLKLFILQQRNMKGAKLYSVEVF